MLDWVAAQPASIEDVKHLAKLYANGVYDGKMQVSTSRHKLNRTGGYVMELELNALGVS